MDKSAITKNIILPLVLTGRYSDLASSILIDFS